MNSSLFPVCFSPLKTEPKRQRQVWETKTESKLSEPLIKFPTQYLDCPGDRRKILSFILSGRQRVKISSRQRAAQKHLHDITPLHELSWPWALENSTLRLEIPVQTGWILVCTKPRVLGKDLITWGLVWIKRQSNYTKLSFNFSVGLGPP